MSHHEASSPSAFIQIHNLVKTYATPAGEFHALKGLNAQIGRGEFVGVIGKSGSGKSTFINMITGIDRPSSGDVVIGGTRVHDLSQSQLAEWRGRNLGIVFQFFQLLPTLTLLENIMLPMEINQMYGSAKQRRERAMQLLERVEMADQAYKFPTEVSGGQQQRVAIARALATDPPLIVADEPTGNLDSKTADRIIGLFEELVVAGKTVLMVTHDYDQAQRVGRTILIADGEIVNEYVVQALSVLTQDQLVEVTRRLKPDHYPTGTNVIQHGEIADKFYIITDGEAEVYLPQRDGSEIAVNRMRAGEFFGEMALLGGTVRTATVKASGAKGVSVVGIDAETFNRLVSESQTLADELNGILRKRRVADWVQRLGEVGTRALRAALLGVPTRTYAPHEVISAQGAVAQSMFVVVDGSVEVLRADSGVLREIEAGGYFGHQALLGTPRRLETYRAGNARTEVVELTLTDVERLMGQVKVYDARDQRAGE